MSTTTNIYDNHGFLTFTASTKVISGAEGWTLVSIRVDSASTGNATLTSSNTTTIGLTAQNGITLKPGESTTLGSGQRSIDGLTIVAAAGCTVYVQTVKNQPII
jgi:hypothetical protein